MTQAGIREGGERSVEDVPQAARDNGHRWRQVRTRTGPHRLWHAAERFCGGCQKAPLEVMDPEGTSTFLPCRPTVRA